MPGQSDRGGEHDVKSAVKAEMFVASNASALSAHVCDHPIFPFGVIITSVKAAAANPRPPL